MDEHRKEALRIAMRFAPMASPCADAIETALRSTASNSEKDGYRKGVEDSASCVVGTFQTVRSVEILRTAIRSLIRED